MGVWLGPRGKPKAKQPPKFTFAVGQDVYTREDFADAGLYVEQTLSDGTINWELAIIGSGTLVFQKVVPSIDVFLVGGGAPGYAGDVYDYTVKAGSGGKGGARVTDTVAVQAGTAYSIVIGGSGQSTTAFDKTAASGGGSDGGSGAVMPDYTSFNGTVSTAGDPGGYAFGDSTTLYNTGYLYAPGGGGGGIYRLNTQGNTFTLGASDGGSSAGSATAGGASDGSSNPGGSGGANTGAGGGGGNAWSKPNSQNGGGSGGSGGSGIIIIRNHRS